MKNLILIKLGGSVITDKSKPFTAKVSVIKRLAKEIKEAKSKVKNTDFIIGHGSGSFGHTPASKYQTQKGLIDKQSLAGLAGKESIKGFCLTADAAIDIDRIVVKQFISVGLKAVPFSPMSFIYSKEDKLKNVFLDQISESLKLGFMPVVYGDVIFDESKGFTIYSGEKILDIIARKLLKKYRKVKIIQCGDTDGVYGSNGQTIPKINPKNFKEAKKWITGSKSTDVTGGMIHKVEESLKLAKETKIPTILINGNKRGNLLKAVNNQSHSGSWILP